MKTRLVRTLEDSKDLKYTWVCSGCDAIFRTENEERPKECPDCKVPQHYIYRYYLL